MKLKKLDEFDDFAVLNQIRKNHVQVYYNKIVYMTAI